MTRTLCTILWLAVASSPTYAMNLVANGGFETGDFSGWTQSGAMEATGVTYAQAHTGSHSAFFSPITGFSYLTQTLPTTAGEYYDLRFFLRNAAQVYSNAYSVSWDGVQIFYEQNLEAFDWTEAGTLVMATGTSTELTFGFINRLGVFYLDDVSVEGDTVMDPVPEPASFLLLGIGLAIGGGSLRRWRTIRRAPRSATCRR